MKGLLGGKGANLAEMAVAVTALCLWDLPRSPTCFDERPEPVRASTSS